MHLDSAAATPGAPLPLQFVSIEIVPIVGGRLSVAMQATLLDENDLEFVGQDLAYQHVDTLDDALTIIREHVGPLAAPTAQ
jgi:hypothetical protein